jgi:hypothetical protein
LNGASRSKESKARLGEIKQKHSKVSWNNQEIKKSRNQGILIMPTSSHPLTQTPIFPSSLWDKVYDLLMQRDQEIINSYRANTAHNIPELLSKLHYQEELIFEMEADIAKLLVKLQDEYYKREKIKLGVKAASHEALKEKDNGF